MHFKHLPDVHTRRNAKRIKHDVKRSTIRQERHIFRLEYSRHNALVPMPPRHLVTDGNLTLLRHIATHKHVHTGGKLIAIFAGEDFNVNNNARLTMRNFKGVIANFSSLFTEYSSKQSLLGGEFRFPFRSYLADKYIAGTNFRADSDNAAFVKVF